MSTKAFLPSPVGALLIEDDGQCLTSIRILAIGEALPAGCGPPLSGSPGAEAARQIAAYFAGTLAEFDLPLLPLATQRGEALRAAIVAIPAGETLSYGALARIAGSAPRAIGQACARNVFPIIVPCHRVTGSGGAIGHYSGGSGITTKRWLIDHERRGGLL
jgi:methylated-DNA-[protein]-cysteine S-methyltransferase